MRRYWPRWLTQIVLPVLLAIVLCAGAVVFSPASFAGEPTPRPTATSAPGPVTATVNTSVYVRLNVRSGPGTSYQILGRVRTGESYPVLGRDASGHWLKLAIDSLPGNEGWVYFYFVRLNAAVSEVDVVATAVPAAAIVRPAPGQSSSKTATPTRAPAATSTPRPTGLSGKIAFPSFEMQRGIYEIFLVNADGSNLRWLLSDASQPALSPNGQFLAYRNWKGNDRGLVVRNLDTGEVLRVSGFLEDSLPAWSPDSTRIVFSSYREVDRKPRLYWLWADRMIDWRFQNGPYSIYGEDPFWTADDHIVYRQTRPEGTLISMTRDTWHSAVVAPGLSARSPAVSPDGSQIAYMIWGDGNWDIALVNMDGSGQVRLTSQAAQDGLPAWSPDGRRLAFVSNRGGAWAIWVMQADGRNPRQIVQIPGSIDGSVRGEPDYLTNGWLEEQISWSP